MLGPGERNYIIEAVREIARKDMGRLGELRAEIRGMASEVKPIRPRSTSAVSLVSTDAGENVVEFNPYIALPVRVAGLG